MLTKRWPIYVVLIIGIVQAQCYFPGGDLAADYQYCNPYAFGTLCCKSGWTCFDNGLCVVTNSNSSNPNLSPVGSAARGACTDPLWNDTACGSFCLDDPVDDNDGSVISCGNQNWCCQPGAAAGTCNCASGDGTFSLQDGLAQTIIGIPGLGNTNTNVIPISSASTTPTTASSPPMTTSSTPSQVGSTEAEPTTSSSPGYGTSLSASAASKTLSSSSSSSSPSGQSILTVTIQPTSITMLPSSRISTTSGSNSPTASAVSSIGVPHRIAFKIGISVGLVFAVAFVCFLIFLFLRRRRRRRARRGDFIRRNVPSPPSAAQHGLSDTGNTAPDFDYRTRWPLQSSTPESLANRSGHELHPLVPDHDPDRPVQAHLSGPPAADPYAVPPHDPDVRREASPLQRGAGAASPLNYRPTMRGANRPRGNAYRTLPRAPQAWMPEVPEITQDWPTGEQR